VEFAHQEHLLCVFFDVLRFTSLLRESLLALLLRAFHDALSKIEEAIPNYPCLIHFRVNYIQTIFGCCKSLKAARRAIFQCPSMGRFECLSFRGNKQNVCPNMIEPEDVVFS
jgi:hypothetical protein